MTRERIHPEQGPTPQQLAAFADGELPVPAHEAAQAWLADHPEAQAEVEVHRGFLHAWRVAPLEASAEAWDHLLARVASAVLVGGGGSSPKERWRPRWAMSLVGALIAAAAVVGGVWIAGSVWGPRPEVAPPHEQPIAQQGPKRVGSSEATDEPFPVVSAADVHVISVQPKDADGLVLGQERFFDSFQLASPRDIQVWAVEPHQADGLMPRLEEGAVPMIVLTQVSRRGPRD